MIASAGIVFAFLSALQAVFYYRTLTAPGVLEMADAVVVFMGEADRARKGYDAVSRGLAPVLILSPAGPERIAHLNRRLAAKGKTIRHLVEDRATTTFENALLTGRLISENGLKRCILVTHRYHMPRSLLLLKMVLAGQGVKIQPAAVGEAPFDPFPLRWSTRQQKRFYNEMVEFWGSVLELARYGASGRLPERSLKDNRVIGFLRSLLLFQVR